MSDKVERNPCGHPVASFAWICSSTRRARCAVCDPRTPGVADPGRIPTGVAASGEGSGGASGDAGDESADTESDEINPGERHGPAFAFFDIETPNGAWSVATRFPGLWGRSGGSTSSGGGRGKSPPNITAGLMLGWAAEREGPSLGHARFASIQEWQRSLGVELDENGRFDPPEEILAGRKNLG